MPWVSCKHPRTIPRTPPGHYIFPRSSYLHGDWVKSLDVEGEGFFGAQTIHRKGDKQHSCPASYCYLTLEYLDKVPAIPCAARTSVNDPSLSNQTAGVLHLEDVLEEKAATPLFALSVPPDGAPPAYAANETTKPKVVTNADEKQNDSIEIPALNSHVANIQKGCPRKFKRLTISSHLVLRNHRDIKLVQVISVVANNIYPVHELSYDYDYELNIRDVDEHIKRRCD
ncbi:hypothetical protein DM860_001070 [Cuscuta australis]|uniref:Uncharacterized protein n=1 Tax=Cuscuta australis TaxID=267555 RepID=A0A328DTY8_9ASTE|nr:hypothetical protein DM860_001070 [Cuscuta australis]